MLMEFFVWWGEQLASLVPASMREHLAGTSRRLVLTYSVPPRSELSGLIAASLNLGAGLGRLGTFPLDANGLEALRAVVERAGPLSEILLRLPPGMVLEKSLTLPLAAQRDIARVIEYELDHETPFTADEVYWHIAIVARDRALGQLGARLSLALKRDVDPILRCLAEANIVVGGIIGDDEACRIRLAPRRGARDFLAGSREPGSNMAIATLAILLLVVALVSPFLRQSIALSAIDARIAALQPDADAAQILRRQIGGITSADQADPQVAVGNPLMILAAVTQALPDDTYLSDFTDHHGEIELIGQSAAAAALIKPLSDSPALKDPGFAGSVTRDPGSGADSFAIKADAKQP